MATMIKKVGVSGSGQMRNGIAHVAALAGLDVVLNDVSADRLKSGMATINGNLSRQVSKKIITEDARKQALNRIVSTETIDGLADCDLVIEGATERHPRHRDARWRRRLGAGDGDRDREGRNQAQDFSRRLLGAQARSHR